MDGSVHYEDQLRKKKALPDEPSVEGLFNVFSELPTKVKEIIVKIPFHIIEACAVITEDGEDWYGKVLKDNKYVSV